MDHRCHAKNCKKSVPPRMFMCRKHWYMVPNLLRSQIWENYVPGQEITKTPTTEYLEVAAKAIAAVDRRENA